VDVGSGAGLPGLPLALRWPTAEILLVDRREARTDWLRRAVGRLELGDRVRVVTGDVGSVGREDTWAGWADVVVARAFGRPGVLAELVRPFLCDGGLLVASEPEGADAWDAAGLVALGYRGEVARPMPGYVAARASGAVPPARSTQAVERSPRF
jgi:16S rRNA (guanine527-N7)-methyltransferase